MRPSLRHPIGERRGVRRARGRHRPVPAQASEIATRELAAAGEPRATEWRDAVARRVREAGGPTDQASYACPCGYVFAAPVSTTVECPHCGAAQVW